MQTLDLLHLPEYKLGLVVGRVRIVRERTDLVRVHLWHVWVCLYEFGLELETFLDEIAHTELATFATGFQLCVLDDKIHTFLDETGSLFRLLLCTADKVYLPDG